MAEIFGFSASIITILELCNRSLKLLRGIKDAPKLYRRLYMTMCAFKGVMDEIQETIADAEAAPHSAWLRAIPSLTQDGGLLRCLQEKLTSLIDRLDQAISAEGIKRVGKRFVWPISKEDIKSTIDFIKMQHNSLALAFQNDNLRLTQEIHEGVKVIHEDAQVIREQNVEMRLDIGRVGDDVNTLTITAKESTQRIEEKIESSTTKATHDAERVSTLISESHQQHSQKLDELRSSVKKSAEKHELRQIVVLHKTVIHKADDDEMGEDDDDDDEGEEDDNGEKNEGMEDTDEDEPDDDEDDEDEDDDDDDDESEDDGMEGEDNDEVDGREGDDDEKQGYSDGNDDDGYSDEVSDAGYSDNGDFGGDSGEEEDLMELVW